MYVKIRRAEKGGFCFGVRRAVDIAMQNANSGRPVYTLGPIIHNSQVVDRLRGAGVQVAQDLEQLPRGAVVVVRSHGVPPEVLERCRVLGLDVVDATCPCVKRIQNRVSESAAQGLPVVIIGEREHPEVEGIAGWCAGKAIVVSSAADVEALPPMPKACVVAQTTTPEALWCELLQKLREHIPELDVYPSICHATSERQQEATELAEQMERLGGAVVVVGGRDSSNTKKLYQICAALCPRTWWVEQADELPMDEIGRYEDIAIISGASTPDWIIEEVCTKMSDTENRANAPAEEIVLAQDSAELKEVPQASEPVQAAEPEAAAPEAQPEEIAPAAPAAPAAPKNSFEEAFEKTMRPIHTGQVITGTVVQVTANEVCVNIGYKADGIITHDEYSSDSSVDLLKEVHEGDEMEVEILKINDGEGNVLLSRKNLEVKRGWKQIMDDFEAGNPVTGVGKQVVKGGLIAQVFGVRAFIPASQVDSRYVEDLSEYIGKELVLKILEVEKHRHRVVASRKAVLEAEKARLEGEIWEALKAKEGERVTGVVRRLTDFGAFVEVDGVDGLVHVTDLAWGRVKHPRDIVAIGDEIEVIILKVDVERKRLSLSAKQARPRPWDIAPQKYHVGDIVEGKVVRIVSFGAFVELEPGLDGLVHISQVATRHIEKVEDVLHPDDLVWVKILDVNPDEKRISLSIREAYLAASQDEAAGDYADDSGLAYSTEDAAAYQDYQDDQDQQ